MKQWPNEQRATRIAHTECSRCKHSLGPSSGRTDYHVDAGPTKSARRINLLTGRERPTTLSARAVHFRRQAEQVLAGAVYILVAVEGALLAVPCLPRTALSDRLF